MVLMIFMATSLLRAFRDEQRQQELHEALLRERIQRLLEEHDAQRRDQGADEQSADGEEPRAGSEGRG
jgi:glycine betaine transporter